MKSHILVIDCGSTGIRSVLINKLGVVTNRFYKKIEVLHPEEGATENNPEQIWEVFKSVVNKSLKIPLIKIEAIAITNQRSTFTLWEKSSSKPLINFINWQDVRAANVAREMNNNLVWKSLRILSFFIGRLLRNPLLTVTSMLKLNTDHTICKLKWVLDNNLDIKEKCLKNNVMFGTIDTWLLYKLTGNKIHKTDYTNAAATTLLNPFVKKWNTLFCNIFNIPMNILPEVHNTNHNFGVTDKTIFGKEIPITCMVGDQQASLFGHRCFKKGDLKVTLGSGGFVSMNVGIKPKFSTKGLFPLIAWKINNDTNYKLEGQVATVGTFIDWAINDMNFFKSIEELDQLATRCESTNGIAVIPTLSGIRFPYFKPEQKASIYGLDLNTNKENFARSIIEGISHRVVDIIEGMESETNIKLKTIKIDGGVSNSDIIMQLIADYTGKSVFRSSEVDLACIGAGYLAGLAVGIWEDQEELSKLYVPTKQFTPQISNSKKIEKRELWKNHVKQSQKYFKS